ncbi:acyl-CoA dehydrogenase family protein [Modestobacter excelsi]|uniref:acyl-CoA dehydrogenase family protein n=1 Tax=Modestobacter excelsi TaxID=2213161 RepID=UPI001C20D2B0|nr:acyl-CoA dehydrogenase family protein [Modestobacter excelsi]
MPSTISNGGGYGPLGLLDSDTTAFTKDVRSYLDKNVAPLIAEAERTKTFPVDILPGLIELGYVRGGLPENDGGYGMSHLQSAVLMEEAGRCWGSLRTTLNILSMVAELLSKHGTDDQKERFLAPLLEGRRRGWFALTEPESGSDAGALRTRATEREDGSWVLNGQKVWITNASYGDFGVVLATVDRSLGHKGIGAFLVETSTPGLEINEIPHMPVRASSSCEVVLTEVVVPAQNLLGQVGRGLSVAMSAVNGGRLNIAAGAVGLMQAALEAAQGHVLAREQFGRPLAGFQLVQELIVKMAVQTQAGRLLYQNAASTLDAGQPGRLECSIAKYFCSEAAVVATSQAIQLFGGSGLMEEFPVERLFRDARESTIPEGTSEIQVLQIGDALLGVSALR